VLIFCQDLFTLSSYTRISQLAYFLLRYEVQHRYCDGQHH